LIAKTVFKKLNQTYPKFSMKKKKEIYERSYIIKKSK